jgi:hypothetical protein
MTATFKFERLLNGSVGEFEQLLKWLDETSPPYKGDAPDPSAQHRTPITATTPTMTGTVPTGSGAPEHHDRPGYLILDVVGNKKQRRITGIGRHHTTADSCPQSMIGPGSYGIGTLSGPSHSCATDRR